jgi:hypothetical protein
VLLAQNDVLNSHLQLTSARFDRTIFYLDLVRATGRLHEIATSPVVATTQAATQPTTMTTTQPTTLPTTQPE